MAKFPADARVAVQPFASRREGQHITIGDLDRGVFVTIPAEAVDILDALSTGQTVGEAVCVYEQLYGETPDVEDFLTALAEQGFVAADGREDPRAGTRQAVAPPRWQIPPAVARRLFGSPLLGALTIAVALGVVLAVVDPGVIPGPTVLVFRRQFAMLSVALLAFTLVTVFVHELAHLLVARASDIPARISLSHRLWIVVAETDMSGIWLAPKHRRYFAFLAGPLIDASSAGLLVGVLWAGRRGWLSLSPTLAQFVGAALWTYFWRLAWQCCLFVRTDFYYVVATALDCKRLLADTEDFLRNQLAKLRRARAIVDQSAIPRREMRAIRGYSVVWLAGRGVAIASLVLVSLPVGEGYVSQVSTALEGAHSTFSTVDLVALAGLGLGVQVGGFFLWIRSLYRGRTQRSVK